MVKKIPDNFPNGVLVEKEEYDLALGEARYTIHPEYRTKESAGFTYFASKVLPCVNARRTNFKVKHRTQLLSKIFTVSDEAYALALLINEYDSYQFKLQNKDEGSIRPTKPFTSSASGSKLGWNRTGRETYMDLCKKVKKLRNQQISKDLENTILQGFHDEVRARKKQKRSDSDIFIKEVDLKSTIDEDNPIYNKIYANQV